MAKSHMTDSRAAHDSTRLGRDFKERLRNGELMLGAIACEYFRPSLAKIYRHSGFDFIYVEKEHTMIEGPALADFISSARDAAIPIISKIGEPNRPEVARLLDAGAVGIQLPRTESREQLQTLISYMKFPPRGTRAAAPCFGNVDYRAPASDRDWIRLADESTLVVAHIETRRGYESAEQIISTPGLDMVYIGPYDFSLELGHPGEYDHPEVTKRMEEMLQLCRRCKVPFGTTASGVEAARAWIANGCQFFEIVDELTLINVGAQKVVDDYRGILA